jgi:uncharacterized protein YbdZ (MbtH family)
MNNEDTENARYKVVVNDEGQYSIWAADCATHLGVALSQNASLTLKKYGPI